MSLSSLIQQYAAEIATPGRGADVATVLNASTIVIRDPTPVTYARIRRECGDAVRAAVAATIRAGAASQHELAGEIADAHMVLLNERGGLELHTDERQAMVDMLATLGSWPAELLLAVRSLSVRSVSPASQDGLGTVTAEQCEAEIDLAIREAAYDEVRNRGVLAAEAAGVAFRRGDTVEQIVAAGDQAWQEAG